jgi:calcineurin-like phosphoesterase family protein
LRVVRLAFTSDLHMDHHPEVIDLIAARVAGAVDVLIVAGDVTPTIERLRAALTHLREFVPRVVYVPGNHDLWCRQGTPDSRERYLEALPDACAGAGADYLPAGPIVLDGVTLVGQTGWYDYSLRDPTLDVPLAAYERGVLGPLAWSDKQYVVWPGVDDGALTELMSTRLRENLAEAPRDRPVWVVTHMLPFAELVARRPLPWGFVNGFLGSAALGDVIVAAAEAGVPVARAISGHTHFRRETMVAAGGRTFLAETSPIGYPREIARQGAGSLAAHVADRVPIVEVA